MELRDWAIRILSADALEEKLFAPEELSDNNPGPAFIWKEPTRPAGMQFQKHTYRDRLPKFSEHHQADKRAVCLHRFAGHELLAVEVMACAARFPGCPRSFPTRCRTHIKRRTGTCPPLFKSDEADGSAAF